jgi:predicted Zn-dependent protease
MDGIRLRNRSEERISILLILRVQVLHDIIREFARLVRENAPALRYARAAYGLMPDNPAVAGTLGWAEHRTGTDRDRAVAMLEKAVRLAPLDPSLRFQLARAYAAAGRIADARKSASIALQSNRFGDRQAAQAFLTRL